MPNPRVRTQLFWRDDIESILEAVAVASMTGAHPRERLIIARVLLAVAKAFAVNVDLGIDRAQVSGWAVAEPEHKLLEAQR